MKGKILIIVLTVLNIFIACGKSNANPYSNFQLVNLYGYTCITNNTAIWCER